MSSRLLKHRLETGFREVLLRFARPGGRVEVEVAHDDTGGAVSRVKPGPRESASRVVLGQWVRRRRRFGDHFAAFGVDEEAALLAGVWVRDATIAPSLDCLQVSMDAGVPEGPGSA